MTNQLYCAPKYPTRLCRFSLSPLFRNVFNVPFKIMAHHFRVLDKLRCHASKCHFLKGGSIRTRHFRGDGRSYDETFFFAKTWLFSCVFWESCLAIPSCCDEWGFSCVSLTNEKRAKRSVVVFCIEWCSPLFTRIAGLITGYVITMYELMSHLNEVC